MSFDLYTSTLFLGAAGLVVMALFMPETRGGTPGAANVFYAVGEEAGFGFSPFAIEDDMNPKQDLAASYRAIQAVAPLLLAHQAAGDVHGFILDRQHPDQTFTISGNTVHVSLDSIFGSHSGKSINGLRLPCCSKIAMFLCLS